jgi:hypothetical protein
VINLVDIGVILLLTVAAWRIFHVYLLPPRQARAAQVTLGLLIRDVPPYVSDSITAGQDLFQEGTNSYIGKISSKTAQPAERVVAKDGRLTLVYSPCNFDLRLKLRRNGQIITGPARSGIFLGKLSVRIGGQIKAHTLYTIVTGEIDSVRVRP